MKQRLVLFFARWAMGGIFRDIAEGKKGPKAKAAYWWLVGKKRPVAAILGLLFAALVSFDPALALRIAPGIALVIGVLVTWGFVDAKWREMGPLPEWAPVFAKVMSVGPIFAGIVALIVEVLQKVPDTRCAWCDPLALKVQLAAAAVAASTAWLSARFTEPPAISD